MNFITLTDLEGNPMLLNLKYFVRAYVNDERTVIKLIEGICVVKETVDMVISLVRKNNCTV